MCMTPWPNGWPRPLTLPNSGRAYHITMPPRYHLECMRGACCSPLIFPHALDHACLVGNLAACLMHACDANRVSQFADSMHA